MDSIILAHSGFGEIFLCGRCNNIHLSLSNFTTSFSVAAFREFESMVTQANKSLLTKAIWKDVNIPSKVNTHN